MGKEESKEGGETRGRKRDGEGGLDGKVILI